MKFHNSPSDLRQPTAKQLLQRITRSGFWRVIISTHIEKTTQKRSLREFLSREGDRLRRNQNHGVATHKSDWEMCPGVNCWTKINAAMVEQDASGRPWPAENLFSSSSCLLQLSSLKVCSPSSPTHTTGISANCNRSETTRRLKRRALWHIETGIVQWKRT